MKVEAVVCLAALCLAACGSQVTEPESTSAVFAPAACESPLFPGYPQLDLGPEFRCGHLTVPENRAQPDGRTITLAVARAGAQSSEPGRDPLLYLTGGPGGSAFTLAAQLVKSGINRDRDVIFVDQRGTLKSSPLLSCPEIDRFLDEAAGMSIQAPATAQRDLDAVRSCHDRLATTGVDLSAYNTAENAADLADLRAAMKIDQWHVYGVSYGSDLALQLLRDHPKGITSLVLDSVVPPQTNLAAQFWPSAGEGYRALFDACAAQPACHRAYPNLSREFTDTVHRLAKAPLAVDVPASADKPARRVVIDGYTLANLVVIASLAPGSYDALPQTIHALAAGDGRAAAQRVIQAIPALPGYIGYGLMYGVFCREGAALTDPVRVLADARKVLPDLLSEVLSLLPQIPRLFDECGIWDVGRADPAMSEPTHSDVPVLLMTGGLDAVTPPSQADLAATTLSHGRVVRFPGLGHDVLSASDCGRHVMADFLIRPDGYDTSCVDAMRDPTFAS